MSFIEALNAPRGEVQRARRRLPLVVQLLSWAKLRVYLAFISSRGLMVGRSKGALMRIKFGLVVGSAAVMLLAAVLPSTAAATPSRPTAQVVAAAEATCDRPESDAEALVILNYYYPNRYVWDDADLTVAVQAAPNVTQAQLAGVRRAIETWGSVLRECFDGRITLTDVTGAQRRTADIVVHYVPTAGGTVFGGFAICGARGCPNIIVRSDLPPSAGVDPYSPEYLYYVTLHELGHALGLGHATNLLESTDLMGYGWNRSNGITPVLSQCDVDALAYLFSWALNGTAPPAPGPSQFQSTFDCAAA